MDYHRLTQDQYDRLVGDLVKLTESLHERAQDVGDGRATIGYGYTFNRNNNVDLWRASGIELTESEWQQLAAIDTAPPRDRTRLGLGFDRQLTPAEGDQLLAATVPEYESPIVGLGMPVSRERAALVSLVYNRGEGSYRANMQPFRDAVEAGDRAEAWFEMRYNSWGSNATYEAGLRKRRYMESELFGLYDDPRNVTADEALSVYRTYQLHRNRIDSDERRWGVDVDGNPGQRNLIAEANRDYAGVLAARGNVQTLAEALEPARTRLLGDLRAEYPEIAEQLTDQAFNAGSIHVDPGRDGANVAVNPDNAATLDAIRVRNRTEIQNDDLLLGDGGNDTLRGAAGNDLLIGGEGRDRLEGGQGRDVYVAGAGDTIVDSDGVGVVRLGGQVLSGGTSVEGGDGSTYRSEDGRFHYQMRGADLVVTDREGGEITIEDFQPGNLGIALSSGGGDGSGTRQPIREEDATDRRRMLEGDRVRDNAIPLGPQLPATSTPVGESRSDASLRESDPRIPDHPDHRLYLNVQSAVRNAEAGIGKAWDENSERLCANLYGLARDKSFGPEDALSAAFSSPTATRHGGELVFLYRQGANASPDPYANRTQMATNDATANPSEETFRTIAIRAAEQGQDRLLAQPDNVEQQRAVPRSL